MSAPRRAMRDAQEIRYGFLAAKAAIALEHALKKQALSKDERETLASASKFLDEIANGALIMNGKVLEGVRPSQSLAALDVAFGPLELLKNLVQNEQAEIAPLFRRLSDAVTAVRDGTDSPDLTPAVDHAQKFFDGLSGWLANELTRRKHSSVRVQNRPL